MEKQCAMYIPKKQQQQNQRKSTRPEKLKTGFEFR